MSSPSNSIFNLNTELITFSQTTRKFLYNDKSFTIITPWLNCKGYKEPKLIVGNRKFSVAYSELMNLLATIANVTPEEKQSILEFKIDEDVGFFEYKLQQETIINQQEYSNIFNEFCQVKLELKIKGISKQSKIIVNVENCAFKSKETIDFQISSELESDEE